MTRLHVKPGQSVVDAFTEARSYNDAYDRAHSSSAMTFELGLDHVILNGHRIVRPSGVSRSSWDIFWSKVGWKIINLH